MKLARTYLTLALVVGAAQLAGCMTAPETTTDTAEDQAALTAQPAPAAEQSAAEQPGAHCTQHFEFTLTDDHQDTSKLKPAATCPADAYFHPTNGAAGGWIESWRLCNQGGGVYQICTGGYAPVRYYNPSSCNGTIYDYYPQGWHGNVQTFGGCC